MKTLTFLTILVIMISYTFGQDACLKITRLTPRDTVSEADYMRQTVFLIESMKDTLEIDRIASSCGCEVSTIAHGKIYPNCPDTVYVQSLLVGRAGPYRKATYLRTKCGCHQTIYTDFYVSKTKK